MIRILLHGACGRMGQVVSSLAAQDPDVVIAAGADVRAQEGDHLHASLAACTEEADVVIDFASAAAVDGLLDYCVERKLPVVLCTTGLSPEQIKKAEEASRVIPVLRSANMSLGVNLLLKLLPLAARVLAQEGFDMEIVERHHNQKLDAPSGTALALADALNGAVGGDMEYVSDRTGRREKRPKKEIGISAVRGGNIVGDHEVIFAGTDEVVEIRHTATSRGIFGKGAIAAAKFLAGKEPGLYSMQDVIG